MQSLGDSHPTPAAHGERWLHRITKVVELQEAPVFERARNEFGGESSRVVPEGQV